MKTRVRQGRRLRSPSFRERVGARGTIHRFSRDTSLRPNPLPERVAVAERAAFSLLEVILALAVMAGAIAVLSELSGIGLQNARIARDSTYAQLLCESKLAELVAGIEPLESQEGTPLGTTGDDSDEPDWLYSVEVNPTEETGLLEVRVTVYKDLPEAQRPVRFSLVRWFIDPSAFTDETGTTTQTDASQQSGNSSQTGMSTQSGAQGSSTGGTP